MVHAECKGEDCFGGTNLFSPGRNLVIDEFDNVSEPETTTMMDQDDVLHLDVLDSDIIIDPQVGGHPGNPQPTPSDPLMGETLSVFSQSPPTISPPTTGTPSSPC